MAQVLLTLDTLGDLDDGGVRAIVNGALADAVRDLDERGEDGKPREVTVKVTLNKMEKSKSIVIDVQATTKMPSYKVNPTIAETKIQKGKAALAFQQHSPDDPRQQTLDELDRRDDA